MAAVVGMILVVLLAPPVAVFAYAVLSAFAGPTFVQPCEVCGVDVKKGDKRDPALCEDCFYYGSGR